MSRGLFDLGYVAHVDSGVRGTPVERQVAFLRDHVLPRAPGSRVLDHCCGHGRHLASLAAMGWNVVGVDINEAYVQLARERVGDKAEIVLADVREFRRRASFDAVVSLESSLMSFGPDDARTIFGLISDALVPGGVLAVHVVRPSYVMRLPRRAWFEIADDQLLAERRIVSGATLDVAQHRFTKRLDGAYERTDHHERFHLYSSDAITGLAATARLVLIGEWGGFDGSPPSDEAPDHILLFQRDGVAT